MILYFTGTGNSRFVASKLAEATGRALVDIAPYLREGRDAVFSEPGVYVFVSPTYAAAPPPAFLDFIRRSVFPGDCRAYFIMTCVGTMGASPGFCARLAAEKGFTYLGTAAVEMPQNYIARFETWDAEHNRRTVEAALPRIAELAALIRDCRMLPDPGMKSWEYPVTRLVAGVYNRYFTSARAFAVTDGCIGCGKCASVCPLNNIQMADGRPVWGGSCTHCMACINLCPKEAIEYGKKTLGKPRYRGPEASLKPQAGPEPSESQQ